VGFDMKVRAFEDQYLERDLNGQLIRLYIVQQVPLDTKFAAKTKNEIKVSFYLIKKYLLKYMQNTIRKFLYIYR
jgi:hypothetical protein